MSSHPDDLRSPIDPDDVASRVAGPWRVRVVSETGSSNADLLAAADRGEDAGAVLVAEFQSGGRGRMDRTWSSPAGAGLTFSVLVRPVAPVARWGWLPLIAGLALYRAVGETARLKWPNDLLLGPEGRKVAGILVQAADGAAVVGVGLNATTTRDELPVDTATSLALELHDAQAADRAGVLAAFLAGFGELLDRWEAAEGDAERSGIAQAYREACDTLGAEVTVQLGAESVAAKAVDIDSEGRLLIQVGAEPELRAVASGDVTHLRPGLR